MRVIPFLVSAAVTSALVIVLNMQLPIGSARSPKLGLFLSPQLGFWQNAEPADESFGGEARLEGLRVNADVYFDSRLVPHVYAETDYDAYYIQGYLHAKFRLWQMDFQTRAAGGRLSEVLGKNLLSTDRFFRRLGMVYAAENSLKEAEKDPVTIEAMNAYTAGVNAWIERLKPNKLPLEYKLLDFKPEPWTNLKTCLFLKFMSFDLAGAEWDFELANARQLLGATDFEKLYPIIQDSLDPILPKGTVFPAPGLRVTPPPAADSMGYNGIQDSSGILASVIQPEKDNGSNNWAVAGSRTASGRPILCNDPHLGLNLPSLWYEMQITTPSMNAYGASFPGAPAVIIGFNDSASWGFTNAMRDVRDYYQIEFRDSTMQEYRFNNQWLKAGFRKEHILVRDSADAVENIAMTVFGPVMFDRHYDNKLKDGKYYACRWKAHDPSNELITFIKLNKAKNLADYRDAISSFECPGQNMIFATKTGDIAITQQGEFPAKWKRQGDFPMPGTDSSFMWQGMIPPGDNPQMINPPRGFVSSANQLPADSSYPYYLGGSYPPYRGLIINRRLSAMQHITPGMMMALQSDNYNVFAEFARPILLRYIDSASLNADERHYLDLAASWNLRNDPGEKGASVFKAWWDSLEVTVFADEIAALTGKGTNPLAAKWPDESTLAEGLLSDSTAYRFVDDITTPVAETLGSRVLKALRLATPELKKLESENRLGWSDFKATGIRHLLRIPALSRLNLPIGGGEHIINATKQFHGPSWRMVVHLTDDIEAYGVYPGGQNGNPGSRYYDNFVDAWTRGQYYRLLFLKKDAVASNRDIRWHLKFTKV
ncbi:MAG TPA: penicillin acylase family protein [Chitinophagaceae bacterium]